MISSIDIVNLLDQGRPTLLILRISSQFHRPPTSHLITVVSGDVDTGMHAVVAVGYGSNEKSAVVLLRNSWGPGWGDEGHIWATEEYLTLRTCAMAASAKVKSI